VRVLPVGWLQSRVGRPERVLYPFDGFVVVLVRINGHNIEAHNAVGELRAFCEKQCRCSNDLALLVDIDGQAGPSEAIAAAIAYFDKDQAIPVAHNQIDFAEAATEVPRNRSQARAFQESVGESLSVKAYSSRVASSHDSSSATSGNISSGSSLMS